MSATASDTATSNANVACSAGKSKKEGELHPHNVIDARHKQEHPNCVASMVVFFPIDNCIHPILLSTMQRDQLVEMRILVFMDLWPVNLEYMLGHYIKMLGVLGTKDIETLALFVVAVVVLLLAMPNIKSISCSINSFVQKGVKKLSNQ